MHDSRNNWFLHTHRILTHLFHLNPYEYTALDVAEQQTLTSRSTAVTSRTVVDTEPSTSVHQASEQLTGTGLPMKDTAERKQRHPLQETAQQDDQ